MKSTASRRSHRMADLIMRELAQMVLEDLRDPRVQGVTLSGVRMNKDLRIAEVMFSVHDGSDPKEAKAGLDKAKGFLRAGLGKRVTLKYLPDIRFIHDDFLEEMVYGKPHSEN